MTPSAASPAADGRIGDALARDLEATGRLLGVNSVRASIVELKTMTLGTTWTLAAQAEPREPVGDSVFALAPAAFPELGDIGTDEMMLQRPGPRRWAFAWRLDDQHAIVGDAQFGSRRETLDAATAGALRLLCCAGLQLRGSDAVQAPAAAAPEPSPGPQLEHHAQPLRRRGDAALLVMALAGLLLSSALLALLPRWQAAREAEAAHLQRWQARGERTVAQGLALAMASGSDANVQSELQAFASLGYFSDALVTNAQQRVMAMVGAAPGQTIGMALRPELQHRLRPLPLAAASQPLGTLWRPIAEPTQPEGSPGLATAAAGLLGLGSLVSALVSALRLRRR